MESQPKVGFAIAHLPVMTQPVESSHSDRKKNHGTKGENGQLWARAADNRAAFNLARIDAASGLFTRLGCL